MTDEEAPRRVSDLKKLFEQQTLQIPLPVSHTPHTPSARTSLKPPSKPSKPKHLSVNYTNLPPILPPSPVSKKVSAPNSPVHPVSPQITSPFDNSETYYENDNYENYKYDTAHEEYNQHEFHDTQPHQSSDSIQRQMRLKELVDTEKSFEKDLRLLLEIYMDTSPLSSQDNKSLFANLPAVAELADDMAKYLETAVEDCRSVGNVFLKMIPEIESVYAEYCKHHQAAITLLAQYSGSDCPSSVKSWLKDCQLQLVGKTGAWDLQSLVIKPVQRVLKYPLLLKDILKETPSTYPDFESLTIALAEIEKVAENINEIKKRKDIVDKYVEGKKLNIIHGVNKKFTRGVQELKQATGIASEASVDVEYSRIADNFNDTLESLKLLKKNVLDWYQKLMVTQDYQETLSKELLSIYRMNSKTTTNSSPFSSIPEQTNQIQQYHSSIINTTTQYNARIHSALLRSLSPIDTIIDLSTNPLKLMTKRSQKLLDISSAKPENKEQHEEEYAALNEQLCIELTKFVDLSREVMDLVVPNVLGVMLSVYENEYTTLVDRVGVDKDIGAWDEIEFIFDSAQTSNLLTNVLESYRSDREDSFTSSRTKSPPTSPPTIFQRIKRNSSNSASNSSRNSLTPSQMRIRNSMVTNTSTISSSYNSQDRYGGSGSNNPSNDDIIASLSALQKKSTLSASRSEFHGSGSIREEEETDDIFSDEHREPDSNRRTNNYSSMTKSEPPPLIDFGADEDEQQQQQQYVVALYDYDPVDEEEIALMEGWMILVVSECGRWGEADNYDWWEGVVVGDGTGVSVGEWGGKRGWFPATYVSQ